MIPRQIESIILFGVKQMRMNRLGMAKTVCILFLMSYSFVIGGFLAVVRNFIWNMARRDESPLPLPTDFIVVSCYSTNGYSPYWTYAEIMLIAVFLLWIPLILYRNDVRDCLLMTMCGFMGQTFAGALLGTIILIPLWGLWCLEWLNPPQMPTPIAVAIHHIALWSFVCLLVVICRRLVKNRRKKDARGSCDRDRAGGER